MYFVLLNIDNLSKQVYDLRKFTLERHFVQTELSQNYLDEH